MKRPSIDWRATWSAFRQTIPFWLGWAAGLGLAYLSGTIHLNSMADDGRTFTLFAFGAVNGWLLCLLYRVVTGKSRRKRKRTRRVK